MNPKTHWQSIIHTKELREPLDSYEILKLKMKKPGISAQEIAETLNYDKDRIHQLSHRYFHASRVHAFNEYQMKQLAPQIIAHTSKQLHNLLEHDEKQSVIASNHEYILARLQKEYTSALKEGKLPPVEVRAEYKNQFEQMDKHRETESRTTLNYAKVLQTIQEDGQKADGTSEAVQTFVQSIQKLREEQ